MSERAISDPTEHGWTEVDGKWMWGGSGGGTGYDDTEVRGLIADNAAAIATNASDISGIDARVTSLENATGGSYTAGNGITIDGSEIKMSGSYSGTFTANTVVGSG